MTKETPARSRPQAKYRPVCRLRCPCELALDMRWSWNHATDKVCGSWMPSYGYHA